jgi:hypothetical protein
LPTTDGSPFIPAFRRAARFLAKPITPLAFSCLIFISTLPAVSQNPPADDPSNTIHGVVVNTITHDPISRALVTSSDNRYATFTNNEGRFEFTLPNPEKDENGNQGFAVHQPQLSLTGRKPGYLDDRREGKWLNAAPGSEVTISLTPEALIKGRITSPSGDSVRGINVQLFRRQVENGSSRWRMASNVIANSDGEFRFAELRPGAYKLCTREWMDNDPEIRIPEGQQYGFPPVYYPNAVDFAASSTIQLTAGEIFDADLPLVRKPYYAVNIPVTNADEIRGLNVTVSPQGQPGPGYSLGYDHIKQTITGQLPDGKYLVGGTGSVMSTGAATVIVPASFSGSVNIAVAAGESNGPTMVLSRDNSIPINVKEQFTPNTQPTSSISWNVGAHNYTFHGARAELNVQAESVDDFGQQHYGSVRQPTGPNDDALVLENMAPERYWLRLTAMKGYVASATMGGTDLLREPLAVVPGASPQIDVTLRDDFAELEGSLVLPATTAESNETSLNDSSPRAYIYCLPLPDSTGRFLDLTASADGKFDYQQVAPGAYRVIAFDSRQNDIPYRDAEAMKAYESKGQIVHLGPGEKVTLQLQPISGID